MRDKKKKQENKMPENQKKDVLEGNPFYCSPHDRPETVSKEPDGSSNAAEEESTVLNDSDFDKTGRFDEIEKTNQQLKNELETLNNQYVRLAADFDNFRKRQSQERQDLSKLITADVIENFLPSFDSLDKAYISFKELDDVEKLKESFNVLYRQMQESMIKVKVVKIKTAGELFDPNYHEAVMQEETTEYPDNVIMLELQPGYMVDDKVIRPSMVKVASNPDGCVAPNMQEQNKNES
ncbi:MAG: nucleotide exchange factor GrpE [Cyanobacteriota bacterium]